MPWRCQPFVLRIAPGPLSGNARPSRSSISILSGVSPTNFITLVTSFAALPRQTSIEAQSAASTPHRSGRFRERNLVALFGESSIFFALAKAEIARRVPIKRDSARPRRGPFRQDRSQLFRRQVQRIGATRRRRALALRRLQLPVAQTAPTGERCRRRSRDRT